MQVFKNELRETVKGQNMQPGKAGNGFPVEQLAFDLKRGLLRRDENQRRSIWRPYQRRAHFGEAAERLAAARRAEKETHLHKKF